MATEFTIMVNGDPDMKRLISHLEQIVGHPFTKNQEVERNLYQTNVFGAYIDVFDEHDLVNDLDIEFERYLFAIDVGGLRRMAANPYHDELLRLAALVIGSALAREWEYECMVVRDLQYITEVFPAVVKPQQV